MMKVKVKSDVAKKFKEIESLYQEGEKPSLIEFIVDFANVVNEYLSFMQKHCLTDEDLINAYKYGWEVEYEFKKGDVVFSYSHERFLVITEAKTDYSNPRIAVNTEFANDNKNDLVLVCKLENREDLKQC